MSKQKSTNKHVILNPNPQKVSGLLLHELFTRNDQSCLALSFFSQLGASPADFSYGRLDRLSDQVAFDLVRSNIIKQIIPVVLAQSPELYIVILGILKSGNAFCPILPSTVSERISFICTDVEATTVYTATHLDLPSSICQKGVSLHEEQLDRRAVRVENNVDALAYTMYTSGSTGIPKAVLITHGAATASILAHDEIFSDVVEGDSFLQFASPTFDISIFEMFSTWARGMKLIGAERSILISTLPQLIEMAQVKYLELTPSMAGLLPDQHDHSMRSVKVLITIGELLTCQIISKWAGKLFNAYGPTEATLHASFVKIGSQDANPRHIGRPLSTCSLAILKPDSLEILEEDEVGELCIAGPQVALGYLNRKDLTDRAFIKHPQFSGLLYRTGDLASIIHGEVYFAGRIAGDAQIKVNGQRFELGELASAIQKYEQVSECEVISEHDRLYAFVVTVPGVSLANEDMTSQFHNLPLGIHPIFISLDSMPLSAAGKRDLHALRGYIPEVTPATSMDATLRSDLGLTKEIQDLLQVVRPILGKSFRSDDTFSLFGLDSLGAIKIVMSLRKKGILTTVFDVLDSQNVQLLSERLATPETEEDSVVSDPEELSRERIDQLSRKYHAMCTFAPCAEIQASMLSATLSDSVNLPYYNHIVLQCRPNVTVAEFERAWHSLITSHEILRTGFHVNTEEGSAEFFQVIHPIQNIEPVIKRGSKFDDEFVDDHKRNVSLRPDNLAQPAVSVHHARSESQSLQVSVMIHHALYDAWSLELILDDLSRLLRGEVLQKVPQFQHAISALRKASSRTESSAKYWSTYLNDWRTPAFPILAQVSAGSTIMFHTSRPCSLSLDWLDEKCAERGINMQSLAQLAWASILTNVTGEKSVSMAVTTSGRALPISDLQRTLGPFIKTYPFRCQLSNHKSISEALRSITEHNNLAIKHDMSYREILRCSANRQAPDTLLIYQKSGAERGSDRLIHLIREEDRLEFAVVVILDRQDTGILLNLAASHSQVSPGAAKVLLAQLENMMYNILSSPESSVKSLRQMPADLLSIANVEPREATYGRIDGLFTSEIQLQQLDLPALQFYNSLDSYKIFSYRELNTMANKLANELQDVRTYPDEIIAICLSKSPAMYASILATWKLGCAYVAIDPSLPDDRLHVTLDITNAKIVFTDEANAVRFNSLRIILCADCIESSSALDFDARPTGGLAYMLMTSGTTGIPKACAVTHSNVLSNCAVLSEIYPHTQDDRMMQFCSYTFDVSVFEIVFPWYNRMCLVSCPQDLILSDLNHVLSKFQVTHLSMTASAAALVRSSRLPYLKCLITAGESSSRAIIDEWGPSQRYFNAYGPTETTNVCNVRHVDSNQVYVSSIGPMLPNSSGFVLDANLELLPKFSLGELYVGGAQVIRGYLGDDEKTSQSFIEHKTLGRIYRSGDLVRILEDESLSIVGRADSQIKIRGHRVELSEINHALRQCPDVCDVATLLHDASLFSFVHIKQPSTALEPTNDSISEILFGKIRNSLPGYMVPKFIVPLFEPLPMTTSHKLDRASLLDALMQYRSKQRGIGARENEVQWSDTSRKVARTVAKCSGVSLAEIRPGTSMFRLGLDSISAIKIAAILKAEEIGSISVSKIMQCNTMDRIALEIDQRHFHELAANEKSLVSVERPNDVDHVLSAIEKNRSSILDDLGLPESAVEMILPCTSMQEGMLLESLKGSDVDYINHCIIELQDGIDMKQLRSACGTLVQRNAVLRSCFAYTAFKSIPCVQVVLKQPDSVWHTRESDDFDIGFTIWRSDVLKTLHSQRSLVQFLFLTTKSTNSLVVSLHHSIFDAWSLDLLLRELESLYQGAHLKKVSDISRVVYKVLRAAVPDSPQDLFWKDNLNSFEPSSLPTLATSSHSELLCVTTHLNLSLSKISKSANDHFRSLQTVLQASWSLLLSQLLGASDVCFGSAVSGRTLTIDSIEDALTPLFNVLPVRVKFDSSTSWTALMSDVHAVNLQHLANPHYPLKRAFKAAELAEGQKLFDTIFILQRPKEPLVSTTYRSISDYGDNNYALTVEFTPEPALDRLTLRLTAFSDHVAMEALQLVAKQLETILRAATENYDLQVKNILTASSKHSPAMTRDADPLVTKDLLHSAFERNVLRIPNSVAIEYLEEGKHERLTYNQLGARVDLVASSLCSFGMPRSTPVLVMTSKAPDLYIAFLGIIKAGLVYTPLAVDTPTERLKFILSDLKPGLVILDTHDMEDISLETLSLKHVVSLLSLLNPTQQHINFADDMITPSDPAYIIYTSGSTGGPKAVKVAHSAAIAAINSSENLLGLTRDAKWLQFAAQTFDMSVYDMSISFTYGVCLCTASRFLLLDDLPNVIQRLQVTHLDLTPSVARTLRQVELPSVQVLFCIGERIEQSIISEWGDKCINVYGPTEAAMACSSHRISQHSVPENIGFPFKHVQLAIFSDKHDTLKPVLSLGELCISGPQLCDGYLNNDEKNQASFFMYDNKRFYRTGDLCRMLADMSLSFVARKDLQIKLRGQRIELDEISSALLDHDCKVTIASTVVQGFPDQATDQLVAYISAASRQFAVNDACAIIRQDEMVVEKLINNLAHSLPRYMIPNHFIRLNYMPLTSSQKIDRKYLTTVWKQYLQDLPRATILDDDEQFSSTENVVRTVLQGISGSDDFVIKKSTSIYHLGLDSISAIQIVAALKHKGILFSVIDVLLNPTVRGMASRITERHSQTFSQESQEVGDHGFQEVCDLLQSQEVGVKCRIYPCTSTQENMISSFLSSGGQAYYNHVLLKLATDIDISMLRNSWSTTIEAYEILRAGFMVIGQKACQYALCIHDADVVTSLITEETIPDVDSALDTMIRKAGSALYEDITKPSLKISILTVPEGTQYMLFSAHHAVFDGYTLDTVLSSVAEVYRGGTLALPNNLEYSLEKLWRLSHDVQLQEEADKFWRSHLNYDTTPFPNLNNMVSQDTLSSTAARVLGSSMTCVEESCKKIGVSIPNLFMCAWAKILSSYTGEATVSFGAVLSGRTGTGLESAQCPCVTTIPVVLTLAGSVLSFCQSVQKFSTNALQYQHTRWNKHKNLQENGLFDSLFVYQKKHEMSKTSEPWSLHRDIASVEIPLSIEVLSDLVKDQCRLSLTYHNSKLPHHQASLMLQQFEALVETLLQHYTEQILDIEKHIDESLLSVLAPSTPVFDVPVCLVHDHVRYFAARTPNAPALQFVEDLESEAQTWTYQQLEEQSNQLANHLILSHKLQDSCTIAVCLDKSPQAFLSILAVLKTGSPFCCLDSTAPIDRRKFIIENSESAAVLCSKEYKTELENIVNVPVIEIGEASAYSEFPTTAPAIPMDDSSLCYILYTSGSTGTPKGCCLSHKSVIQALASFQVEFKGQYDSDSRFLAFASMHFDVSILESYFSWSIGARVCAAPKDVLLSDIPGVIRKFAITHLDLTPQLAATLLPEDAPTLRVFITGGEMLRAETVDHWGDRDILFNFYGPTEVTIGCTALKQVRKGARPSNIGQQWSNCGTIVVSQLGSPKPALKGGLGVLIVSGCQVAEGYKKLPEATAKRFAYNELLQARTYDTGDLVRILAIDNSFDFAGRVDSQIKLRGQRIEAGEIESVLISSDAGVKDAVTLVLKHPSQLKEQLVSFVVFRANYSRDMQMQVAPNAPKTDLQFKACKTFLSTYMVPSYIIPLTKIALTPTNKVNMKELISLYETIESSSLVQYAPPRKAAQTVEVDHQILNTIKRVLTDMTDISDLGDHTSIFELGLDSVSVIGFVRRLRDANVQCSVSDVLNSVDIMDLATALSTEMPNLLQNFDQSLIRLSEYNEHNLADAAEQLSLDPGDIQEIQPCTPLVEGLLSESIQAGNDLHMNEFIIQGSAVNSAQLRRAFVHLVQYTTVLRSRFVLLPAGLAQVFLKNKHLAKHSSSEFPLKASLVSLEQNAVDTATHHVFRIHHALYDGQSLEMMFNDLRALYDCTKSPMNLQRPSFRPAVAAILSLDLPAAMRLWTSQLGACRSVSAVRKSSRISTQKRESAINVNSLDNLVKHFKCAPNVLFQAVWSLFIAQLFGTDSCFGLVVSGRNTIVPGIENMVFPMFNTLPVFVQTVGAQDFHSIIDQLQKAYVNMLRFEHTPLREIKKALSVPAEKRLMDSILVYQQDKTLPGSKSSLEVVDNTNDDTGFALALDITVTYDGTLLETISVADVGVDPMNLLIVFDQLVSALVTGKNLDFFRVLLADLPTVQCHRQDITTGKEQSFVADPSVRESSDGQSVIQAVGELLDMAPNDISTTGSFYSMGLDSIDIIRMSARLKSLTGNALSVRDIMQNNSVSELVHLIRDNRGINRRQRTFTIPSTFSEEVASILSLRFQYEYILPVSPIQSGLLTSARINGNVLYLNHALLEIENAVDIELLTAAWKQLIAVNPVLRTSFAQINSSKLSFRCNYVQIAQRMRKWFNIHVVQCSDTNVQPVFSDFQRANEISSRDMNKIPLFLQYIKTESKTYLALSIHHALYDGASLQMMFLDIQDYVKHQTQFAARPSYTILLEHALSIPVPASNYFWSTYLRDYIPHLLAGSEAATNSTAQKLSIVDARMLRKACRDIDVSVQAIIQACCAILVMKLTMQTDIVVGMVQGGRTFAENADRILGPCMNTIPLRVRAVKETTNKQLVSCIHRDNIDVMDYVHTPLAQIQKVIQKGPLFDVLSVVQNNTGGTPEITIWNAVEEKSSVDFTLAVEADISIQSLNWTLAMSLESISDPEYIFSELDRILVDIIQHPTNAISGIGLNVKDDEAILTKVEKLLDKGPTVVVEDQDELIMAEAIAEISGLEVQEIFRSTSIYAIGMDSISAIDLSAKLRNRGIRISVGDILRNPTIHEMSRHITKRTQETPDRVSGMLDTYEEIISEDDMKSAHRKLNVLPEQIEAIELASPAQVYFLSNWKAFHGKRLMANFAFKLDSARHTFDELANRWIVLQSAHPILRTAFATNESDTRLLQCVFKGAQSNLARFHPKANGVNPISQYLDSQTFASLDSHRPPIGLVLIEPENRAESVLMMSIHHALYDATSLPWLIRGLQGCLIESGPAYTEFSKEVRLHWPNHRAFWQKYLANVTPVVELSWKGSSQRVSRPDDTNLLDYMSKDSGRKLCLLDALVSKLRVTSQSLLLVAISRSIASLFAQENVALGVYVAGRSLDMEGIKSVCGPTVNIVPVRFDRCLSSDHLSSIVTTHNTLIEMNGFCQQVPVDLLHDSICKPDKIGGLVDIAVNILPRRTSVQRNTELTSIQWDTIELNKEQIKTIRSVYAKITRLPSSLDSFQGLRSYRPVLDIEVEIVDDHVNFGVFCKDDLLSEGQAEELVCTIWSQLMSF